MLYWVFLGKNFKKLLPYLKAAQSNLSIHKIIQENKMPKFAEKKRLIWVFLDWHLKTILSYLKLAPSQLSNCKISQKNKNA